MLEMSHGHFRAKRHGKQRLLEGSAMFSMGRIAYGTKLGSAAIGWCLGGDVPTKFGAIESSNSVL